MSAKLAKSTFPPNHTETDFSAFGPPATKDGEFDGCYLADMGCFNQENVDSNKYYHACVVQSKINSKWYTYFEWGRIAASNPQFQFEECSSKEKAQSMFAAQCHSKNDRRGIIKKIAGIATLVAKPGKDVYKVQNLQSRTTGLPDAKNITSNSGLKEEKVKKLPTTKSAKKIDIDPQTSSLLRDLRVGTISFTRSSLEGGNIPTQSAIDEARDVLNAALKRVAKVGDDLKSQIKDKQLKELTYHLYSRIPKKKDLKASEEDWILSTDNHLKWQEDLKAFENAIYANLEIEEPDENPYGDLPIEMQWLPPSSDMGKFLHEWAPKATMNRHGNVGRMILKNAWKVVRKGDNDIFKSGQEKCKALSDSERPINQPKIRPDLETLTYKQYNSTNTALLFHGTRSVNVSGILRTNLRFPKDLPPSLICGAAFGGGSYFADDWKKSAGYTSLGSSLYAYGGGAIAGRSAFMFVMDVALGNPFTAPGPRGYTGPPQGHHSIFGKAGFSGVANNEWIIFNRNQIEIKYLIEFDAKY